MKNIIFVLLLSTVLFSACKSTKMSTANPTVSFDKQGHRGARGLMPENTIPAMYKAIDLGVTTLEMDIVFTSDNVAILSHEPFFNEVITTYPQHTYLNDKEPKLFNIYKMNYAAVQNFDVGMKPHPDFPRQQKIKVSKPSLAALIDSVEAYTSAKGLSKLLYNIETKTDPATDNVFHPAPAPFTDMLMKVIKAKNIEDRVTIQSFDMRTLQYLHKKYPAVKTALLTEANNKSSFRKQLNDLGFNPTVYSPEQTLVTENLIADCHEKNIRIIPWTVNDKKRIAVLKKMGVDGIITDYPDLF